MLRLSLRRRDRQCALRNDRGSLCSFQGSISSVWSGSNRAMTPSWHLRARECPSEVEHVPSAAAGV
eukprot:3802918-Rhodomonas_salina.1